MANGSKKTGEKNQSDLDLWKSVTDNVTPIKRSQPQKPLIAKTLKNPAPPALKNVKPKAKPVPKPANEKTNPSKPKTVFSNTSGFDRRTSQKLLRGNVDIEGRIDLHGMTKQTAHEALKNFLMGAQNQGLRTVLVITGKGKSPFGNHTLHARDHFASPERDGVLRTAVTSWLSEAAMSPMVIGFQPAHPKHGGGGAFYVKIRRRR